MYEMDNRFAQNIDKVGGKGTAVFVYSAIVRYLN